MRIEIRFTSKVLSLFIRKNRSTSICESHIPRRLVSCRDISSRGRSHTFKNWYTEIKLLCDGELLVIMFVSMNTLEGSVKDWN